MFGRRIPLFSLFGFRVAIDFSWFFLAIIITWSLAEAVFAQEPYAFNATTRWIMGAVGALGLFASIVLHELGHALVARTQGMPMKGITLFIFGGVAEMTDEPPTPTAEFLVAIAGPLVSVVLGVGLLGVRALGLALEWPESIGAVIFYLGWINLVLVGFNMVPAFPLDGGRVLRSIIWRYSDSLRKATQVTSAIGSAFGFLLIAMGIFFAIGGALIAGVWWFLLGMFLRGAAGMSMQQVLMRQQFSGEPVSRFMTRDPMTVTPELTVRELVDDFIYRRQHKLYPVMDDGRLVGCVTLSAVRQIDPDRWSEVRVRDIADQPSDANTVRPDADAMDALQKLNQHEMSRLMVVDGDGALVGVLALKDLLGFFSMKIDLEGE